MRVVILTSEERGFASLCVEPLRRRGVAVAMAVRAEGPHVSRTRRLRQITRKMAKIGVLGALNGLRMRRWYREDVAALLRTPTLEEACARLGVPCERTPSVNDERTVALLRAAEADLGLSLGNAWISPRVFTVPREGMLNVHHELLPEFQGAQSVLWALHEGRRLTGFTIHRVERAIDAGAILDRQDVEICFRPTLAETVSATYAALLARSAERLAEVVANYPAFAAAATPQSGGRRFTTPTWSQFRTIQRRWRELAQAAAPGADIG